jgi:hypothetical protein
VTLAARTKNARCLKVPCGHANSRTGSFADRRGRRAATCSEQTIGDQAVRVLRLADLPLEHNEDDPQQRWISCCSNRACEREERAA